jgi:hypothetical protein
MQSSSFEKRRPPQEIRDRLRREVNFGCPFCRSPFLTYHHFDPRWEPSHIHREEGMIALCTEHHNFADGGSDTKEYLRSLKLITQTVPVKGQLPWNVRRVFIAFGGNYFVTSSEKTFAFRVDGKEVFALRFSPNGYLSVNAAIFTAVGNLVCQIDANDILSNVDNLGDLVCSAQGKKISISSKENDAALSLRYERKSLKELMPQIRSSWPRDLTSAVRIDKNQKVQGFIERALDGDGLCPVIRIRADLHAAVVPIRTLAKGITADFRRLNYDNATLTGLDGGEGAFTIVYGNREMIFMGCEKTV